MSISRWITVVTDAAWATGLLLVLLAASLLIALLSVPDTRGRFAVELGLTDEAAATIPSCFCVAPEFDVAIPPHARGASSGQR
jgi:hypothetical protein